jgi:hypothetical protein
MGFSINPEFQPGFNRWEDCDMYVDGKYMGKANIEFNMEFDVSAIQKMIDELGKEDEGK